MHPNITHVTGLVTPQFLSGMRMFIQRSSSFAFCTTLSISARVIGSCSPTRFGGEGAVFFPSPPGIPQAHSVRSSEH